MSAATEAPETTALERTAQATAAAMACWALGREGRRGGYLLTGPGEMRLHIDKDWRQPTHVVISGVYPMEGGEYYAAEPQIRVRADRGGPVIAREIRRRLLSEYERKLDAAQQWLQRVEEREADRDAIRARLAAAVPESLTTYTRHDDGLAITSDDGITGTVGVNCDHTSATVTLSLPIDVAMRVLAALVTP